MGNNHNQYFGKDKRKIVVLGLQDAGKTTLIRYLVKQKFEPITTKTKNLEIHDKKMQDLHVTLFDLGGAERQRVFWKQQYEGTQGIIFVVDPQKFQTQKTLIMQQLTKLTKHIDAAIPFCICLSKIDKVGSISGKVKSELQNEIANIKKVFKVYELDYQNKQSINAMMNWFLKETKPI